MKTWTLEMGCLKLKMILFFGSRSSNTKLKDPVLRNLHEENTILKGPVWYFICNQQKSLWSPVYDKRSTKIPFHVV